MPVTTRRDGPVAYVAIDNPPVNAIDLSVRRGLLAAAAWVEAQDGLSRVVLTGAGRVFAAGADAREFDAPPVAPHLPEILNRIEMADTPWIAAINGAALGGGYEIALACRYRIASPDARIGLPEVTLGVVPGAGGTQRLPRLIGMAKAVSMIAAGRTAPASEAESIGLIDGVADDPAQVAAALDIGALSLAVQVSDMPPPAMTPEALEEATFTAIRDKPGQTAPPRAIELVSMSANTPMDEAMTAERAVFVDLRAGAQSRALRHIFFVERAAKSRVRALGADQVASARIRARLYEAADTVFMDGSTPWEVDEAMVAFGFALGPFEAEDVSGLDMTHAHRLRQTAYGRHIPLAGRMAELGKLGRKTGAGWYRYPGGGGKVEDPIVADLALEEAHFEGRARTDYDPPEIEDRIVLAMINEAARMQQEGVAAAQDIDLLSVRDLGFPRWRGGLVHYADTLGATRIAERLKALATTETDLWAPSAALLACAEMDAPLATYPPKG